MTREVVPGRGFTSPGAARIVEVTDVRACLAFGWVCSVTSWQAPNKTPKKNRHSESVCVCVCDAQIIQSKLKLQGSTFLRSQQDISETVCVRVCVCVCV